MINITSLYKLRGVYAIHNKITDSYYIGCTNKNFGDRRDVHFAMLHMNYHHNKILQDEYNKYGRDSFEFIILETLDTDDFDIYYDLEKKYIYNFRRNHYCINQTDGGLGFSGARLTKERIRKLSQINKLNMTGAKASDKTRKKCPIRAKRIDHDYTEIIIVQF